MSNDGTSKDVAYAHNTESRCKVVETFLTTEFTQLQIHTLSKKLKLVLVIGTGIVSRIKLK